MSGTPQASELADLPTLQEIIATADPDQFVAKHTDVAAINLACAVGLPKAEDIDIPKALAALDAMAVLVRRKTTSSWHIYERRPWEFNHSKNVFRVMAMLNFLHKQFGIHYNPDRDGGAKHDATDAGDQFMHGVLSKRRTGTCASLPVLAVAVGRRLGYPLKLVKVPEHLLFRWEDDKERFNVEYGGDGGKVNPDDYYRTWPVKWDAKLHHQELKYGMWLTSLTPKQEVAKFLETRVMALDELGRLEEAIECINAAERFNPRMPYYEGMRLHVFIQMGGATGLPFVSACKAGRPGELPSRPSIVVTPLFSLMMALPPAFFRSIDCDLRRLTGPDLCVPLTCVVSVGPMFSANGYWNFIKAPAPFSTVEPGRVQLLDTIDPFRDRTKDPKHLFVRMTKKWHEDEGPLRLHVLKIIQQKSQGREGA